MSWVLKLQQALGRQPCLQRLPNGMILCKTYDSSPTKSDAYDLQQSEPYLVDRIGLGLACFKGKEGTEGKDVARFINIWPGTYLL